MFNTLIISCEHAGNQVPVRFRSLFPGNVLHSNTGWDAGALELATVISETTRSLCFAHQTTRLLVEIDSSLGSAQLFSEYSCSLGDEEKQMILDRYYFPFRLRVENAIALSQKPVSHFSIHTFESALEGAMPMARILFNQQREGEHRIVRVLKEIKEQVLPDVQFDFNPAYSENNNGFVSYLRTRFTDEEYAGITITVNQNIFNTQRENAILEWLITSIQSL